MARKIPPRRVPRDRFIQRGGSSGSLLGGRSIPGAHTHVEAHITDLDKYSQAAADAKFVEVGGDTMTGLLLLSAVPVADLGAATKKFVDDHNWLEADITDLDKYTQAAADTKFVEVGGDTMTGLLLLSAVPVADLGAATKKFVDDHNWLEADITDLQAYILDITGEPLGTLSDVTITAIASGELLKWNGSAFINNTLAEAGISATGHTHVEANITDLDKYTQAAADAKFVEIAGDTMTGNLALSKSTPLITLNDTGNVTAGIAFEDAGTPRYVMGYRDTDNTFHLNILGSIGGRSDFVMESTGRVAFIQSPVVVGVLVALVDHTWLEADITDLQAYLVSPLTTDGDILFFNSGHQRLAKGSDTEVLTLASGVPTWAAASGGYTDPLTTDGDILIRDTTTKRLAKGSDTEVLTLASGLPTWAAAGGGVTDHGALTGLGDDDHDQYALIAGDTFAGNVILGAGSTLTIKDAGDTDFAIFDHDGTDFNLTFTNTSEYNMTGFTRLKVEGDLYIKSGNDLRVQDGTNADHGTWTHDGTDFNLVCVNTTDYNITGITDLTVGGVDVSLVGHTHVEANITDLDKYTVAGADAAFAAISHTHLEADITDLGTYLPLTAGTSNRLTGYLYIDSADPRIRMNESDAAANNRLWDFIVNGTEFRFQCRSDDEATATNFMVVSRSANVATKINFFTTALQWGSVDLVTKKMSTDGDILYYNSGRQRLAKGSDLEVLTLASGIPSWAAVTPMTTTGDILYYNSGLKRLAKGADDKVLTMAGNLPTWQDAAGGGPNVTVSTSAASGGGNDGDLWCRI